MVIGAVGISAYGAYKGFRLGGALAGFAAKMYGSSADVTLAPKGMAVKVRQFFGLPVGSHLLQVKTLKGIEKWLDSEMLSGRVDKGDVNAASAAVIETFAAYNQPSRAAMLAVMRRDQLEHELKDAGESPRRSLQNEGAQRIFDCMLDACISTLKDLVPVGDQRGAEALVVVEEWQRQLASEGVADISQVILDGLDASATLGADVQTVVADAGIIRQSLEEAIPAQLTGIKEGIESIQADLDGFADPHHLKNPPRDPQKLIDAHSLPRMARYLVAAGGDPAEAMRLYQWNRAVSEQLYSSIYIVEVVLRNAMDAQLRVFNASDSLSQSPDWLIEPTRLIRRLAIPDRRKGEPPPKSRIETARENAVAALRKAGSDQQPCHDDIVAQTSLRMWRNFLPTISLRDKRRRALWLNCLKDAFPYLDLNPARLGENVEIILQARNRVAHMEPFLRLNKLRATEDAIGAVLFAISPEVAHWQTSTQSLTTLRVHSITNQLLL